MNKLIAASTAALLALTPAIASAQSKLDTAGDDVVVVPVDDVTVGGIGTAGAIVAGIGGLILLGALLGDDDDSSATTTGSAGGEED